MKYKYMLLQEVYNSHIAYGITVGNISIHDITSDKDKILLLVELCNRLKLSPLHLRDVVDDFLVG